MSYWICSTNQDGDRPDGIVGRGDVLILNTSGGLSFSAMSLGQVYFHVEQVSTNIEKETGEHSYCSHLINIWANSDIRHVFIGLLSCNFIIKFVLVYKPYNRQKEITADYKQCDYIKENDTKCKMGKRNCQRHNYSGKVWEHVIHPKDCLIVCCTVIQYCY